MIEGLLAIYGVALETDLSEEWLEYLNIASTRSTTDGSFTSRNFRLIKNFGLPYESTLPYESQNWEKTNSTLENYRCSGLINRERTMCELGHFNPNFYNMSDNQIVSFPGGQDFLRVKNEARNNKGLFPSLRLFNTLNSTTQIKSHLDVGLPIVLDINFFYGAWNHRKASELGIGRDMNHWQQGIVGYPEPNSLDYQKSLENRAGHSVLIVGYDNEKEITTNVRMNDGSVKTFTYKGVYYFKNSWGSESFGASLNVEGEYHSGYGMITQRYAHEHGSFYKLEMY